LDQKESDTLDSHIHLPPLLFAFSPGSEVDDIAPASENTDPPWSLSFTLSKGKAIPVLYQALCREHVLDSGNERSASHLGHFILGKIPP
jgi:hypothetical protein